MTEAQEVVEPAGQHTKRPSEHVPAKKQANAANKPHKSTASASGSTSALAALRVKRNGLTPAQPSQTPAATPAPVKRSKPTQTSAVARPPLREQHKNLQTPAQTDPKARPTGQQPTTGKLKSRMLATSMATPHSLPATAGKPKRKRDLEQMTGEDRDAYGDEQTNVTASQKRPSASGTLKRPGKVLKASTQAPRRPTYDVPGSTTEVDTARPAKRARIPAGSAAKPRNAGTVSKPEKRSQEAWKASSKAVLKQSSKRKQKAVVETRDRSLSSEPQTRKQPVRTAKPPVNSPGMQLQAGSDVSSDRVLDSQPKKAEEPSRPDEDDGNGPETIEAFEQTVVDFAGDEKTAEPVNSMRSGEPPVIKTEQATTVANGPAISDNSARGANKGATQEYAIELSDGSEPSSPIRSSSMHPSTAPPALTTGAHMKQEREKAPQTPAVPHSSPPIADRTFVLPLTAGLLDAQASRKSTIISFDKSGPRNQGSASVRRSVPGSALTDRTALSPRRAPLPSEAGSARSRLDARRRKGPSSVATSMKTARVDRVAPASNVAQDVGDALAGFLKKPKAIPPGAAVDSHTLVNGVLQLSDPPGRQEDIMRDGDGFANIDDYEGTTFVDFEPARPSPLAPERSTQPTASQRAMPPPAPKERKKDIAHRAPTVPRMLASEVELQASAVSRKAVAKPGTKRTTAAKEQEAAPEPKRQKIIADAGPPLAQPSTTTAAAIGEVDLVASQPTKVLVPDSSRRIARKISRHTSQGNVDIHGSPIPKGLIVLDNTTALETFSQQAGLSSDEVLAEVATAVHRKHTAGQRDHSSTSDVQMLPPPSHQPETLSSNTKLQPASPGDESQAITDIVVGRVDDKQLVIRDAAAPPPTDPFTSSEDARPDPPKGSTSSIFAEQLRQHAARLEDTRRQAASSDPDKTLVEPEVTKKSKPKRMVSISSDESSETSASSYETSTTMRDVGMWRSALQPYQMNLFDELVNVSHRLVRHLVDRETATREAVQDYRRRGLRLIEQMEQAHAQQYQEYLVELKQRKKRLRRDLNKCSAQVKDAVAAVEGAKAKRNEEAGKRAEEERKLQELMAQYR